MEQVFLHKQKRIVCKSLKSNKEKFELKKKKFELNSKTMTLNVLFFTKH